MYNDVVKVDVSSMETTHALSTQLRRFNSRSVLEHYGRPIEMLDVDSSRMHYTPQFYFRGFQIDGQRRLIYVHNKRKPEQGIRIRRIENIEVSKDAFSVGADNMLRRQEQMQANILSEFYSADVDSLNALISDRKKATEYGDGSHSS